MIQSTIQPSSRISFPISLKAVIIDLDGTLLDTAQDLALAANAMLRELHMAELPRPPYKALSARVFPSWSNAHLPTARMMSQTPLYLNKRCRYTNVATRKICMSIRTPILVSLMGLSNSNKTDFI